MMVRLPRPLLSRARFTRCPACSTWPVESFAAARSIVPPGPILPILVVEDAESAIRFINKRSRPLAAYVFSRDHEVRLTFERQTSSGALGYSLPLGHLLSSRLPFGGVGASGIGTYHGKAGFLTFSHVKTVVTKPQFPDTLRLVYPPFNEANAKLFDIIAKFS